MSKTIVIPGASSGFGALTASALADDGHTVYAEMRALAGEDADAAADGERNARDQSVALRPPAMDALNEATVKSAVDRVHVDPMRDGVEAAFDLGDKIFLDELETSVPALRRYARALTRDINVADDLVQDCLERAIRKRGLWRPTSRLQAWLFRLLLNLYRNDLRRAHRRGAQMPFDELVIEPSTQANQPGVLALAEVSRTLDRLPGEQRRALLLVVVEGTSYADAAEILGIPAGTLMSRLGRARAALRTMTGVGDEPGPSTMK